MKQAFIQLLFKYAFENLHKELKPPIESIEAKEEYLEEIDDVKMFLEEWLVKEEKGRVKLSEVHALLKRHSDTDMSTRDFAKALERHGFVKAKIGGIIYVVGVKFKTKTDEIDFIDDSD